MTGMPPKNASDKFSSYRALLGQSQWMKLHPAIRKRFSEDHNTTTTYVGIMHEVYLSRAGKLLAQICRLIGTPLALHSGTNIPMKIDVYVNKKLKGITWDRYYLYPKKPINRIRSTKCIKPDVGLIEVVGFGFGMQLKLYEKDSALCFESTAFFCQLNKFRIPIPNIISPGKTVVVQKALDNDTFQFSLNVKHPVLGQVFRQLGVFREGG